MEAILSPEVIISSWAIAMVGFVVVLILLVISMFRNARLKKMAKKKQEEDLGGDVVALGPRAKKGLSMRFQKDNAREEMLAPDELPKLDENPQEPEEEKVISVPVELRNVAAYLQQLADAMEPPETPEQKKIRELEEAIKQMKGGK